MELYEARDHYILQDGDFSLWCNRSNGDIFPGNANDLCSAWNPVCLGIVYGVVGKFRILADSDWRLILIRQQRRIGDLPNGHPIYKIERVTVLTLSTNEALDLEVDLCKKHHFGMRKTEKITQSPDGSKMPLQKTWNQIKSAAENVKPKKKEVKEKEKFDRRVLEEILKMFNELDSFYYSTTSDLTNTIQRQHSPDYDRTLPLWKRVDDRFFWNKTMLDDLIQCNDAAADHWIVPIIQGYIQIEHCRLDFNPYKMLQPSSGPREPLVFTLGLISRRCRHRAGTRVRCRGVDEDGHVANYVETEQIIATHDLKQPHTVAFVLVRGSIPVFWSQSGIKYRPPPRLDKGEKESHEAFKKHFERELSCYKKISVISLVELAGREKIVSDAFLNQILLYNSPLLTYVTFDFHDYCRGMKFENVSLLLEGIRDLIREMRYCWVDNKGLICEQRTVFRINCIDCLDRTNVVQTALARVVMETQCRKLGLLPPDESLPMSCRLTFQTMWANNGDAISRQYAGTVALKGDFTRTGERKLAGMMKDGANSVNRYYLRFKSNQMYRQAAIDLIQGIQSSDILNAQSDVDETDDQSWLMEKEESIKHLIDDCKRMMIIEPETCLGSWGLIDCDISSGDPQQDMDTVLLLTQIAYYIISYDDEMEKIAICQRINLEDIVKIEIGLEPAVFKSKFYCMRIHYRCNGQSGYFHTFRATNSRLFNNILIIIKNQEEAKESLRAICESFAAAQKLMGLDLIISDTKQLDRKKSKPHPQGMNIVPELSVSSWPTKFNISRESSSNDLQAVEAQSIASDIETKSETSVTSSSSSNPLSNMQKKLANFNPMRKVNLGLPTTGNFRFFGRKEKPRMQPVLLNEKEADENLSDNSDLYSDMSEDEDNLLKEYEQTEAHRRASMGGGAFVQGSPPAHGEVVLQSCGLLATENQSYGVGDIDETDQRSMDSELQFVDNHLSSAVKMRKQRLRDDMRRHSQEMIMYAEAIGKDMASDLSADILDERDELLLRQNEQKENSEAAPENPCQVIFDVSETSTTDEISEVPEIQNSEESKENLQPPAADAIMTTSSQSWNDTQFEANRKGSDDNHQNKRKLLHTNMKISLSDGSISYRADSGEVIINSGEAKLEVNPLSKLRTRMANIQLPNFQSQRLRRQAQIAEELEMIKQQKLLGNPCHSRIIHINEQYVAGLKGDRSELLFL
ncbi:phosphatidylinositide phosphatase SAC2-like isoform X2 [Tubulanus polymorphus]|uniref:phosphatidylinositide phosphatase SAC2-like isoform X2 n=1 Tax=Tubulanus polymorphus TaxID=672921 RepID=UPI003DA5736A